jgi:hypothetical protein
MAWEEGMDGPLTSSGLDWHRPFYPANEPVEALPKKKDER